MTRHELEDRCLPLVLSGHRSSLRIAQSIIHSRVWKDH